MATGTSNIEPRIPYGDLREWIEAAQELGEIKRVKGLSWQQDIGMVDREDRSLLDQLKLTENL